MALGSGGSNHARSAWPEVGDPTERQSNRPTCDPKGGWPCVRSSPGEDIEALPIRATRDLKAVRPEGCRSFERTDWASRRHKCGAMRDATDRIYCCERICSLG